MHDWLDERVREIRDRVTDADEGALWLLLFEDPDGAPIVASAIDGAMTVIDLELVRNVAWLVDKVPATAVLCAVPRANGAPQPEDRQLWRDLQVLLRESKTRLLDLVVVGATTHWSATAAA